MIDWCAVIRLVLCDAAVSLGKILRLHYRSLALAFISLRMTMLGTHFEITIGLKFIQAWVLLRGVIRLVLCDAAVPLGKILRLHSRSLALAFISLRMTMLGTHFEITIGLKFIQAWVLLRGVIM